MARRESARSAAGSLVALAIVAYFGLHAMAVWPAPKLRFMRGVVGDPAALGALLKSAATVAQYMLPLMLLALAAISVFQARQREQQRRQSSRWQAAAEVDGMTWHQFELLVGEAFRQKGYTVAEIGGSGPDGGVDLVLRKPSTNGSETFLVQCKHWKAFKVSVNVVRELYGVMAARGAAGGFVVTSGRFTDEAKAFAEGRNVQLIDGLELKELLKLARPTSQPRQEPFLEDATMVVCPLCSHPMVLRTAKRGQQAGQAFYGCSTYPACKGTKPA